MGFAAAELAATSGFIPDRFFFIFDFSQPSTPIDNVRSSAWTEILFEIFKTSLSLSAAPEGLAGVLALASG